MEKKLRVASCELRAKASAPSHLHTFTPSNFHTRNSQLSLRPNLRGVPPAAVRARGLRPNFRGVPPAAFRAATGFTFIEVLFAVIILGIGFIMIAGIFPVAIQQTAVVSNETQGSLITRDAIRKIQDIADAPISTGTQNYPPSTSATTYSLFQPTLVGGNPTVQAFSPNIMQALGSDCFYSSDRRFGWAGFYRRDSTTSPFAQIFIVALQNPNFPNYTTLYQPGETTLINPAPPIPPVVAPPVPPIFYNYAQNSPYTTPTVAPNQPTPGVPATTTANVYYEPDGTTTIEILYPATQSTPNGATGAYVLLAGGATPANMVGRFFRLGAPLGTSSPDYPTPFTPPVGQSYEFYQVQSGTDITPADATANGFVASSSTAVITTATIFMVGRAPTLTSGTEFTGPFTGPNQDIGVASAFIRINTANN
jgi:type II secretory pathway pseudopilin PulG